MARHHIYLIDFILAIVLGAVLIFFSANLLTSAGVSAALYGRLVNALITIVFGYAAIRFLAASIQEYGRRRPRMDEGPLSRLASLFGYVVLLFLVLGIFQINLTGALIGAGFLGIVIGLASQSTLGNMFAGITMMAAKPFAIGDNITFSTSQYGLLPPSYTHRTIRPGYTGVIREIGLMYTKVKLEDGTALYVPNNSMSQAIIINYAISDMVEVNVRAELPLSQDFEAFRRKALREIEKHKHLVMATKGRIDLHVTDINSANYGVDCTARCAVENKAQIRADISKLMLKVAAGLSERPRQVSKR